jgi:Ca2+-transporting ATPase
MRSLEHLVVAKAQIRRGSDALVEIDSSKLVVGDIVYIEEGSAVPADLRLIETTELSTNDFALTGESNPSHKFVHAIDGTVPLGNRNNQVYMGTTVATGSGIGVVIATGEHTELGRIANLSQQTMHESSPLQKEMGNIAKRVTQGTLILCLVLLPFAIYSGLGIKDALLFAIAIAASLIPQGLPAEINTGLAQAASKLAAAGALVKKLSAVETLGATNIIFTDKTGTLTENQMSVEKVLIGRTHYSVSGSGYNPKGDILDQNAKKLSDKELEELQLFFTTGVLASNASIGLPDDSHPTYYALGDPTEAALLPLAQKAGLKPAELTRQYTELRECTFDSGRKRMSSIRKYGQPGHEQTYVFVKGSPESVLQKCIEIWDHGHTRKLTAADRKFIAEYTKNQANQAMRNLGFAYRVLPAKVKVAELKLDEIEEKLVWLGEVSMIDPLRSEVPAAMQAAHEAQLGVSIITGDHADTAKAIAQRAGLNGGHEPHIISGEELTGLSDAQLKNILTQNGIVFSRVAPEDKLRIVQLAQSSGNVVAVTGDGINDAPALKRANIGVAMGKTGTDVAKNASEIILLDDSFNTLVDAVRQGRTIFQNIKKAALSCFTSNAAELTVSLIGLSAAAIFHIPLALSVMQILAIDLVAELFPIAALGNDKAETELMKQKPRKLSDHILNRRSITDLLFAGALMGALAFANYLIFFNRNGVSAEIVPADTPIHYKAMAMTYLTIVLCQLANILMRRSENGLFTRYQLHNRLLWGAMALSLTAVLIIIYVPFIAQYFKTGPLSFTDWLWAIAAMGVFIAIREFQRYDARHHRHHLSKLHFESTNRA